MHFIHKLGLFCCISKKSKKFMINVLTNFEMNTVPYVLIPFLTLSDFFCSNWDHTLIPGGI